LSPFAERDLWNIDSGSASLRLDVEGPDDVAPLLRFVGDELAEVGGRTDERCATQIGESRLDIMIGESGVGLLVELLDDLRQMIIAGSSIMPIPITALRMLPDRNRASTASASDCSDASRDG
jgi:hypothetical protein